MSESSMSACRERESHEHRGLRTSSPRQVAEGRAAEGRAPDERRGLRRTEPLRSRGRPPFVWPTTHGARRRCFQLHAPSTVRRAASGPPPGSNRPNGAAKVRQAPTGALLLLHLTLAAPLRQAPTGGSRRSRSTTWRRAAACRSADGRAARNAWEHRARQELRAQPHGCSAACSRGLAEVAAARLQLRAVRQGRATVAAPEEPAWLCGRLAGWGQNRSPGQVTRQAWPET
jgi:hypothetical protein